MPHLTIPLVRDNETGVVCTIMCTTLQIVLPSTQSSRVYAKAVSTFQIMYTPDTSGTLRMTLISFRTAVIASVA